MLNLKWIMFLSELEFIDFKDCLNSENSLILKILVQTMLLRYLHFIFEPEGNHHYEETKYANIGLL